MCEVAGKRGYWLERRGLPEVMGAKLSAQVLPELPPGQAVFQVGGGGGESIEEGV